MDILVVLSLLMLVGGAIGLPLTSYTNQSPLGPPDLGHLMINSNCPFHPIPVDLPTSMPTNIAAAISKVVVQFTEVINTTNLPGIAYSIVYKDKVLKSDGLGVKHKESSTVPDGNTIFRIGSVSKVFATLVLYRLYDRGLVKSLDDYLTTYCPDFQMQTEYNITLRQMAAQMSGLPREAPCGLSSDPNVFCPLNTKQILEGLSKQRTLYPPWTVPSYSNLAYALLGHCLVERFFPKMTYEDYVENNILQPLQMKDTGFKITDEIKARMATGYNVDGSVAPLTDLGWIAPAGQMYSTTNDLNKLAQFFLDSPDESTPVSKLLSPALRNEMLLQVYVNRDTITGFGTPWEIRFQANYTVLRKGGNVAGYTALFSFIPELKLALNVLLSGAGDEFAISNAAYDILIPGFISALTHLQEQFPYPPKPQIYEGTYESGIPGQPNITILTKDKQLYILTPLGNFYLAYRGIELALQLDYPDNLAPCLSGELGAARKEWVYFAPAGDEGFSPSFTIPGIFSGTLSYKRVK